MLCIKQLETILSQIVIKVLVFKAEIFQFKMDSENFKILKVDLRLLWNFELLPLEYKRYLKYSNSLKKASSFLKIFMNLKNHHISKVFA